MLNCCSAARFSYPVAEPLWGDSFLLSSQTFFECISACLMWHISTEGPNFQKWVPSSLNSQPWHSGCSRAPQIWILSHHRSLSHIKKSLQLASSYFRCKQTEKDPNCVWGFLLLVGHLPFAPAERKSHMQAFLALLSFTAWCKSGRQLNLHFRTVTVKEFLCEVRV